MDIQFGYSSDFGNPEIVLTTPATKTTFTIHKDYFWFQVHVEPETCGVIYGDGGCDGFEKLHWSPESIYIKIANSTVEIAPTPAQFAKFMAKMKEWFILAKEDDPASDDE